MKNDFYFFPECLWGFNETRDLNQMSNDRIQLYFCNAWLFQQGETKPTLEPICSHQQLIQIMCTDDVYCPLPPVFPARLFSIRDEVTPPLFGWKRRPVWTVCGLQSWTTAERISHRVLSYTWSCMSWNPPLNNAWPVRVGRQSLRGAETWDGGADV